MIMLRNGNRYLDCSDLHKGFTLVKCKDLSDEY